MAGDGTFDSVLNAPVSACRARARATQPGSFRPARADNVETLAPPTTDLDGFDKSDRTATGVHTATATIVDAAVPHLRSPVSDTTPRATPAR